MSTDHLFRDTLHLPYPLQSCTSGLEGQFLVSSSLNNSGWGHRQLTVQFATVASRENDAGLSLVAESLIRSDGVWKNTSGDTEAPMVVVLDGRHDESVRQAGISKQSTSLRHGSLS